MRIFFPFAWVAEVADASVSQANHSCHGLLPSSCA
jgi:hypothetical protein